MASPLVSTALAPDIGNSIIIELGARRTASGVSGKSLIDHKFYTIVNVQTSSGQEI